MRYLAYLLLLANLGLFVWIYMQPASSPPEYRPIPVPPGIDTLVLLSERKAPVVTEKKGMVSSEPKGQMGENGRVVVAASQRSVEDERVEAVSGNSGLSVVSAVPEISCQTVGPLLLEYEASELEALLAEYGYDPHQREGEVREPSGYWVYMPAMPADEARGIVSRLDAHGMDDYFIGKQNHISLGIFSRRDKAQYRLDEVRALGIDAILDQRYRTRTVYWLDITERGAPLLGSPIWKNILQQHTDIRVQRVSCE